MKKYKGWVIEIENEIFGYGENEKIVHFIKKGVVLRAIDTCFKSKKIQSEFIKDFIDKNNL